MKSQTFLGIVLAVLGVSSFVVSDTSAKWLCLRYSVYEVILYHGLFAWLSLTAMSFFMQGGLRQAFQPHYPKLLALRALCVACIGYVNVYAFTQIPLADAYTLFFTAPIWACLMAMFFLKETVNRREWLFILGGVSGIVVAFPPAVTAFSLGHLAALCGAVIVAIMNSVARKMGEKDSALTVCYIPLMVGIIVSVIVMQFFSNAYLPVQAIFDWSIFALGGICVSVGFILMAKAFSLARIAVIAPISYGQMIWALGLGWLIFQDIPTVTMLTGAVIIMVCGLGLMLWPKKMQPISDKAS